MPIPDGANPYTPGQPVAIPELFFGRRDVIASIRDGLVKGRRVFLVAGARRVGRSSLLHQLPAHLPDEFVAVRLELAEEPVLHLDRFLWRLADQVGRQLGERLKLDAPTPPWDEYEGHTERFLDLFWPHIRAGLGQRLLVVLMDDLDALGTSEPGLLDAVMGFLALWRSQDSEVALVATTQVTAQERLAREYPRVFGGSLSYVLGPLSSEDAIHLITRPVEGILSYDYGVPRRLVEITSGQPYYLHLICSELFVRCAGAGWANQRDVDLVLEELVNREIPEFRQIWDESTPQEKAVLAALVSLRGARGVATGREVHDILVKAGSRLPWDQLGKVLDGLASREILERLGAASHRFRVGLLRDWLDRRLDLREVVRATRGASLPKGGDEGRRVTMLSAERERRKLPRAQAAEEQGPTETPARSQRLKLILPWVLGAGAVLIALLVALVWMLRAPSAGLPAPTASSASTVAARGSEAPRTAPVARTAIATPTPTLARPVTSPPQSTPSPTPPFVVARSLPAIAYLSRASSSEPWMVYLMTSDGTHRAPLVEAPSDYLSAPSWSPDGSQIAFVSDRVGNADIWVVDSDGQNAKNLTRHKAKDHSPAWSPDGNWIAFASLRDSLYWELYIMRPDGSEVHRVTWWEDASDLSPSWSPDGERLAFASKRDGNWEIYTVELDGSGLTRITDHPSADTNPAWSPDGRLIAFQTDRDGFNEIYVVPVSGGEAVNLTRLRWATDLGPTWSPDGGRIAFYSDRDGDWDIYVMDADGTDVTKLTGDATDDELPAWRP